MFKRPFFTARPIAAALCSALLLGACTTMPPKANQDVSALIPADWQNPYPQDTAWQQSLHALYDDPRLKTFIDIGLKENIDLRQTALRLKRQRLITRQTNAQGQPQLDAAFSSERQRLNDSNNNEFTTQRYNSEQRLALDLSWELDVWGRLANATEAEMLEGSALYSDLQAARHSLAARLIQGWLDLGGRQAVIATEQARIRSLENTEDTIRERYRSGQAEIADLETARTETEQARSNLAALYDEQAQAERGLQLLLGNTPKIGLALPEIPTDIALPSTPLPATLLSNRPDLQAAYLRILSADARQQAAYKDLLPTFTLSSSLSQARPNIGDLLSGSTAWSLLGRLSAPLFDGGRRRAEVGIQALNAQQAYLDYRQTLLTALNEVENALGQEISLAEQERHTAKALRHAEASRSHFQSRYRQGLADILDLLSAEQTAFDVRIQSLQLRQARLTNRITLGLALGMGVPQ